MLSPLRNRIGIPVIISVAALVFAMLGGAYAASNSDSGPMATVSKAKKKAKKKAAKAKRGPRGPKGPAGPAGGAGPAGPAGSAGAKGDTGAAGQAGPAGRAGADGAAGQSVTTAVEPPFGECGEQEGVRLNSASGANFVCNGAPGPQGSAGSPWIPDNTLPAGATQTGAWAFGRYATEAPSEALVPISFPIPLAAPLTGGSVVSPSGLTVHFIQSNGKEVVFDPSVNPGGPTEVDPTNCGIGIAPNVDAANPQAKPGHLCVYAGNTLINSSLISNGQILRPSNIGSVGADVSGATLVFKLSGANARGAGTWAVTG